MKIAYNMLICSSVFPWLQLIGLQRRKKDGRKGGRKDGKNHISLLLCRAYSCPSTISHRIIQRLVTPVIIPLKKAEWTEKNWTLLFFAAESSFWLTWTREGNQMPEIKKLLRSKHVAHILDLSPDDVVVLARKGKIRAKKMGKVWKFRYTDVMKYRKRVGTAQPSA